MRHLGRTGPKGQWRAATCLALVSAIAALGGPPAAASDPLPAPSTVSLEADAASVTVPAKITLEATTDVSLTDTGHGVYIFRTDGGEDELRACGTGTVCGAAEWVPWGENENPQPRTFHVELRDRSGAVIASDTAVVEVVAAEWSVDIASNASSVTIPAEIKLERDGEPVHFRHWVLDRDLRRGRGPRDE